MSGASAAATLTRQDAIRVLLVDDSSVVRACLAQWVAAEPGFRVAGGAANGRQALDLLAVLAPDIILLDIDMPELDGLSTLPLLLARRPDLSVVMVSTLTRRNAKISLQCLEAGAVDYLTKPEAGGAFAPDRVTFRRDLIRKLTGLSARHRLPAGRHRPGSAQSPARPLLSVARAVPPRVVAIGASTGGPQALGGLLRDLGEVSKALPILIVQHMPELFTAVFAEQLRTQSGLAVAEAQDGERLQAGRVYLAPGRCHLGVAILGGRPAVRLDGGPHVAHCRPAVDVLFSDIARVFGPAALGIVLTGMGSDGTAGARALVEAGSTVIVQDEATSVVWGMPGSIAKAGLARDVLPISSIADAVRRTVRPS
jgi:two-component system chemotaxis response regulator CheB